MIITFSLIKSEYRRLTIAECELLTKTLMQLLGSIAEKICITQLAFK